MRAPVDKSCGCFGFKSQKGIFTGQKIQLHKVASDIAIILALSNYKYHTQFFQVDFFWINRDQRSFEWFVNLLSQLEIEQAEQGGSMERFLDMHMYITSALQKTDMKAVGLQLALDLLHKKVRQSINNEYFVSNNLSNMG